MNKRRHHQNRREVVVTTPEEHEVEEIRIKISIIELHIMTKTKIGRCPPKTKRKKEVGKSTKGRHQFNKSLNQAHSNNPRTIRKIKKKQTPEVKLTKFLPRSRRSLERMTPKPSSTRSTRL